MPRYRPALVLEDENRKPVSRLDVESIVVSLVDSGVSEEQAKAALLLLLERLDIEARKV